MRPGKETNDYDIYGYEYYGYGIEEQKKWIETDCLWRKFISRRKKSDRKEFDKPRNPIGFRKLI